MPNFYNNSSLRLYLICLGFLTGLSLYANNRFVLTDSTQIYELEQYLEVAEDSPDTSPSNTINHLEFQPIQHWKSFDAAKTYWGKITIENKSQKTDWVVTLSKMFTRIEFYELQAGKLKWLGKTGTFLPANQRTYSPEVMPNLFHLVIPLQSQITLLFKSSCERRQQSIDFHLRLTEEKAYFQTLTCKKELNSFYIGIVIMLLCHSFILFWLVRKIHYIAYTLYLVGVILFNYYLTGSLANLLSNNILQFSPQYIYLFKLTLYPTLVGYMVFIRKFLQLETILPFWDRWFRGFSLLSIPWSIVHGFFLLQSNFSFNFDILLLFHSIVFVILIFFFLISLSQYKHRIKVWFIFYGTLCMWIGTLTNILLSIYKVDISLTFFQLGSTAEFLFYSVGLGYNHFLILKDQQKAAFALEKSKLQQQQQEQKAQQQQEIIEFKNRIYEQITHEFKTPLTVIKGLAQLDCLEPEDHSRIFQNADQLLNAITQLLDLSKLESKITSLQLQKVDIIPLINYWVNSLEFLAKEKQQQLSIVSQLDSIYLDTDIRLLEKIITNLVTNAIKYTKAEAPITIAIKPTNQHLLIEVQDTGPGIPSEDIPYIFDRFFKANNSINKMGTGLGLSIVKECTELLKGNISVTSEITSGTTFSLQFPIEQIPPPPNLSLPTTTKKKQLPEKSNLLPPPTESKECLPTILIIEDNQHLIYYFKRLLNGPFRLEAALDGATGLEMAIELMPDLIICDVMMPKMDGFEVCNALKEHTVTNHIPIIMVTAKSADKDRIKGFQAGVDVYLNKPFNPQELLLHIQRLQNRKRLLHQSMEQLAQAPKEPIIAFPQEAIFQKENDFIQKINEHLDQYAANPDFKTQQLATLFFISDRHFRRKFKDITGYSPTKYVRLYKVFKAKGLLHNKEMTISQIAVEVGFNNIEVFNRVFKEFYGITPSEMRQT